MQKVRILHLTHTDPRSDNRILKELEALKALDNIALYSYGISSKENNKRSSFSGIEIRVTNLFSKINWLPRPLRYSLMLFEFYFKILLFSLRIRPSIIHCHDTLVLPIGYILKKIFHTKLIYDAHELESNKNGQNKILSSTTLLIEKMLWNRIDVLISVSQSILDWYNENLGAINSTLILNSPSHTAFDLRPQKKNYLFRTFNIPYSDNIFVYIGFLSKGRGIELLIDSFIGLEHKHLVFIGYGPLEIQLKEYAEEHYNIHFHEALKHEDVTSVLDNVEAGFCLIENVSLSDYYSLPNKLFEYLFGGIPVIGVSFPEISRIISNHEAGLICHPNKDNLQSAILNFRKAEFKISNLELLSWEKQEKRLQTVYKELLKI